MIKNREKQTKPPCGTCVLAQLVVIYLLLQLSAIAAVRRFDPAAMKSLLEWDGMSPTYQVDLFKDDRIGQSRRHDCCGQFTIQGMPN